MAAGTTMRCGRAARRARSYRQPTAHRLRGLSIEPHPPFRQCGADLRNGPRTARHRSPDCRVLIPRFAFRESRFTDLHATHLLRLPFNAGRHLIRSVVWSYAERTWFSLAGARHGSCANDCCHTAPDVLYVRDVVCAAVARAARPAASATRRSSSRPTIWRPRIAPRTRGRSPAGSPARMDRIALGRAHAVVSLTKTFTPIIDAVSTGAAHAAVAVIPDAYDDAVYTPQDRDAARGMLDMPLDAFLVCYTGSDLRLSRRRSPRRCIQYR